MALQVQLPSFLDNDFYKFTMQHCVVKLFSNAYARYQFINRGAHVFPEGFADALKQSVKNMERLKLTEDEKHYLARTCPYLDPVYLDFLQGYCYNPSEVIINQTGGELSVIVEGYWYRTILWEVPLLALISELYNKAIGAERINDDAVIAITKNKIEQYNELEVTIAEFGTRRRFSFDVHKIVVNTLKVWGGKSFVGSSNVYLSYLSGTKPIGTHAHEWFMFHAAKYGYKMANVLGLENWINIFRGDLGIALSDTFTTAEFFEHFDRKFAKLFDGVRHDSGDPLVFAQNTIAHYKKLGIDPASKTIIFSDALNYEKVKSIAAFCKNRIMTSFGIGTNFTNDVGVQPMNIVMKMTETRPEGKQWIPVIKLSDDPHKHTGDTKMIALAKAVLSID